MYLRIETGNVRSLWLAERLSGISSHGPISQGLTWRRSEVMYHKRRTSKLRNWAYTGGWCNRSFFPVPAGWGRVGRQGETERESERERDLCSGMCTNTLWERRGMFLLFYYPLECKQMASPEIKLEILQSKTRSLTSEACLSSNHPWIQVASHFCSEDLDCG